MASRLVLQQLGRRVAIGSPATATATASGSGLSAPARAFSSGSTNGPTVASNSQGLGHCTGARSSQFREIAKLKKEVNNMDIVLSHITRRLLLGDALRHQEPAASSGQVLDALGLGAFYGFLGGFMLHFVISKSQTDNGGSQW